MPQTYVCQFENEFGGLTTAEIKAFSLRDLASELRRLYPQDAGADCIATDENGDEHGLDW